MLNHPAQNGTVSTWASYAVGVYIPGLVYKHKGKRACVSSRKLKAVPGAVKSFDGNDLIAHSRGVPWPIQFKASRSEAAHGRFPA